MNIRCLAYELLKNIQPAYKNFISELPLTYIPVTK